MIALLSRVTHQPISDLAQLDGELLAAVQDDAALAQWGSAEELAALQVDLLQAILALLVKALTGKTLRTKPIQRPNEEKANPRRLRGRDLANFAISHGGGVGR